MSAMLMLTLFQEVNKGTCNAHKRCILQCFMKRRRISRGTIYVCMNIYIYIQMYVCSHIVTPPPS